jgi:hypothetical protein
MTLSDLFNISEIKKENIELKELLQKIGATDAIEVKKRIEMLKSEETQLLERKKQFSETIQKLDLEINEKKKQIIAIDEELMLESFAFYKPQFSFQTSDEFKQRQDVIRDDQKKMIKSGLAATGNQNWSVNGSQAEGKKMVNDMIKLVLRSFNNECDYCIDNVKFNNIDIYIKRITTSFESLNKLGRIMKVTISGDYYVSKIDELHIAFEYQQKKQEEKEELRRLKEEMREQEKLEREIRTARERIAKERKHISIAIEDYKKRLTVAKSEEEKTDLNLKINELQKGYANLDQDEKQLDYREQNAKAGYIYIISNLGAFGENVFKIGMTRRLEPYDRIIELGDASVPFPFDTHALFFSENAPELEAKIQNNFHKDRLNKINPRKEFFKADINEIEKVIKLNFNKVVDFKKQHTAEQYRESLLIKD